MPFTAQTDSAGNRLVPGDEILDPNGERCTILTTPEPGIVAVIYGNDPWSGENVSYGEWSASECTLAD